MEYAIFAFVAYNEARKDWISTGKRVYEREALREIKRVDLHNMRRCALQIVPSTASLDLVRSNGRTVQH